MRLKGAIILIIGALTCASGVAHQATVLGAAVSISFTVCERQFCRFVQPPPFKLAEAELRDWSRIEHVQAQTFYLALRGSGDSLVIFIGTQGGDSSEALLDGWFTAPTQNRVTLRGPRYLDNSVLILPYLQIDRITQP